MKPLTKEKYRCLVGHLMWWKDFDMAMKDLDIHSSKEEIVDELYKYGYEFKENGVLFYNEKQND